MINEPFDPYRLWLGIPAEEQPPNYYRLLGIALFESAPEVINSAAEQQIAHVRYYQTGRYAQFCYRIQNELQAAQYCLLDAARRADYDAVLRRRLGLSEPSPAWPGTSAPAPAGPLGTYIPAGAIAYTPSPQPAAPYSAPGPPPVAPPVPPSPPPMPPPIAAGAADPPDLVDPSQGAGEIPVIITRKQRRFFRHRDNAVAALAMAMGLIAIAVVVFLAVYFIQKVALRAVRFETPAAEKVERVPAHHKPGGGDRG